MANQCCVCKGRLGRFDQKYVIAKDCDDYVLCDYCNDQMNKLVNAYSQEDYDKKINHFNRLLDASSTPEPIKNHFAAITRKWKTRDAIKEANQRKIKIAEQEYASRLSTMLLTTGTDFQGYRVVKYIDVICEEVLFKNSFVNRLSASFEDLGNLLTFNEKELSGSGELIARARMFVKERFRQKAAQLGANAVLGVEFESSVGADIVRVAISGTAVVIAKIIDVDRTMS